MLWEVTRLYSLFFSILSGLLWLGFGCFSYHAAQAELPESLRNFVRSYCADCHDSKTRNGELDLTEDLGTFSHRPTYLAWVRLYDRVHKGQMPPEDADQPSPEEKRDFLESLSELLILQGNRSRSADGRTVVRRLNRFEFENTLRDLLDVPWLDIKDLLPDDGRASGFTKSAQALDVSPVLIAKYAEAIDIALDAAVAKWCVPPEVERVTLFANQQYDFKVLMGGGDAVMLTSEMKYDESRFPMPSATNADGRYPDGKWQFGGKYQGLGEAEKAGAFKDGSTVGMTRTFGEAFAGRFHFAPVHPGRYQIGVSAWSYWWDQGAIKPSPRTGSVGVYCGSKLLGFVDAPSLKPTYSELDVDISPTNENHLRAAGTSFLDSHVYFSQGQIKAYSGAGVAIDKLVVVGPLHDQWPPVSHRRLFGNLPIVPYATLPPSTPKPSRFIRFREARGAINGPGRLVEGATHSESPQADIRSLLAAFLPRAFRRPCSEQEIERYAAIAELRLNHGGSFEDALLESYRTALVSPDFLFLIEQPGPLDDYAIATRLSYGLWNSCPDDKLLKHAQVGGLKSPQALRETVDRMLNDPKADRFFQDFPDQWLDLRDFGATSPDKQLYPEFQPDLEDAMRREPREFFKYAILNRLSSSQLWSTSINIVNQRLAEHYGFPDIDGVRFRRVDVDPAQYARGGFLSMAAVCKVTANGSSTSPVKRGAWVMRKVFGESPQPPPPDIAAVEPDLTGAITIREQLTRHRDDANCARCHSIFDPPGFALETFDVIGGKREFYRATQGAKAPNVQAIFKSYLTPEGEFKNHINFREGSPVDPSGEIKGGKKFHSYPEYQSLLKQEDQRLSENLANQLVMYLTGAPVDFTDRKAVSEILQRAGGKDPPLNELLHQIVQSSLFLNK